MSDSLLGSSVGNYVITILLGEGGMGQVYLAEHPQLRRRVAIKVLSQQFPQATQRFLTEAQAVARIDHPNVVEVYDFGSLPDGRLYYVMEFLAGRELRAVMREKGKLSAVEVQPYLEQISAGLQAAHDQGVVHRDLKPQNIFVLDGQPLTLKILDFGIAKLIATQQAPGLTSTGMVVGTPLFVAPEQAAGQPERISPRTDIYALGVILFWMLAGRPPFVEEAAAVLVARHILTPPPPLLEVEPAVPRAIARLVDQCLAKDPSARPPSASALAAAWTAALAGHEPAREAIRATPLASTSRTGPGSATLPAPATPAVRTTLGSSVGELAPPLPARRGRLALVAAAGGLATAATLWIWSSRSPAPSSSREGVPHAPQHLGSVLTTPVDASAGRPASQPTMRAPAAAAEDSKVSKKSEPAPRPKAPTISRRAGRKKLRPAPRPTREAEPPKKAEEKATKNTVTDSKPAEARNGKKAAKKGWVMDPVIP